MRAALPRPPEPPVAGAPPTYHDMEQAVRKGSPASSLDELPRPLVSAVPGFGLHVLVGVLEDLASGTPSRPPSAVLHLCLAKKPPAWLVRNSRPVMLQPYLRQLETGVVQDRRVTRRELRRAAPPEHFAYRRQLPGQTLALAYCWLLTYWAIRHGEIWSDDWDEENAFCNPDREAARAWGHEAPEESLSPWLQRFYDGLDVLVASPYGLAGPYKLSHGGAQGDSQGVGYFSKVSEKRTEYLRHAVRGGLYPEDGRPGAPDPAFYVPRQPAAPRGFLPEVAQRRPPPLRPLGVVPGLVDGHLRGQMRGSLRLSAGRGADGVPPSPAPPPAALRLGHPDHEPGPAPAAVQELHAHRHAPGDA